MTWTDIIKKYPEANFLQSLEWAKVNELIGHKVIFEKSPKKLPEKVAEAAKEAKAELIVVGLPKNMDGSEGESARNARAFAEELGKLSGLETVMQDERGTTITAHNFLNDTNTRGKKRKNVVDEVAATIILQDFLDSRKN